MPAIHTMLGRGGPGQDERSGYLPTIGDNDAGRRSASIAGMPYPTISQDLVAAFRRDGFVVVHDVLPAEDLRRLEELALRLVADRERIASDWDWREGEPVDGRAFRIVQTCPTVVAPEVVVGSAWREWATRAAARLLGQDVEFWYDQFLGKPPRASAPTPWHQDEGYWGRRIADRGITCWFALHDVEPRNGCMHFVRGAHRGGVRPHRNPPEVASDLLVCDLRPGDEVVPCPLPVGSVSFHHSAMPHMTPANDSESWRLSFTQHFAAVGYAAEAEPYDWRVRVDQRTGRRVRVVDGVEVPTA
jgi:hypothetical protein